MAHENNAVVNTEPREQLAKPRTTTLRDGLREQVAIVNQNEKENITNTITVDEVKELIDKDNEQEVKDYAVVHTFATGTKLTQEIFDSIKTGDIIRVGDYQAIIHKSDSSISGRSFYLFTSANISAGVFSWVKNTSLSVLQTTYESTKLYSHTLSVVDPNITIKFITTSAIVINNLFHVVDLGNIASYISMKIGSTSYYLQDLSSSVGVITILYRDFSNMGTALSIDVNMYNTTITDTVIDL